MLERAGITAKQPVGKTQRSGRGDSTPEVRLCFLCNFMVFISSENFLYNIIERNPCGYLSYSILIFKNLYIVLGEGQSVAGLRLPRC